MFENEWGIEDPEDLPVELLEKIKLAFQLLKEANVCEAIELDGGEEYIEEYIILRVPRDLYEEFFLPMSNHTIN
tara:strand:- start:286 stop:507 length:222 start_codon:yes stop_codon:yes gene_type:complete